MNTFGKVLLCVLAFAMAGVAHAQNYPTKSVRMVVPIGAGSSTDIVARIVAQKLTENWGQSVIIDNRPGAGGNIGADVVAKSAPDGYTMLFVASSLAISASYYRKLPYDPLRDLDPVTQVSSRLNALTVSPKLPVNSVKDLIALAKAKPGQVSFGSGGGIGSSDHMAGEMFKVLAGIDILHVPYKGGPEAMNDMMRGDVTFYLGGLPLSLSMINAGKIKALATSGSKRAPVLPNVPTMAEAGVPGYEVNVWYGLFVPHGVPGPLVDKIAADVSKIMKAPELQEKFASLGVDPEGTKPAEFRAYFRADVEKWRKVVKAAGISGD